MVLDSQLMLAIALVLFATAGLVYALVAIYVYIRFERRSSGQYVPVAFAALAVYLALQFGSSYLSGYVLLPSLLLFLATVALIMVVRLGTQARSRAGTRVALSGAFTLAAFLCRTGLAVFQHLKRI